MDKLEKLIELRDTQIGVVNLLREQGYEDSSFEKQRNNFKKEARVLKSLNSQIERLKAKDSL
jgi:hypothetical protein